MGRTNVYGERKLVYVTPVASSVVRYGFKTALDTTESNLLGHTQFTIGTPVNGIVFGARYPRPRKYKKQTAAYSVTSFADTAATPTGFKKVSEAKLIPYTTRSSGRSVLCFTTADSGTAAITYGWFMHKYQYDVISAEITGLGITTTVTDAERKNTVFQVGRKGGTRGFPVPGRYSKTYDEGTATEKTITTYGNAATIPTGWALTASPVDAL